MRQTILRHRLSIRGILIIVFVSLRSFVNSTSVAELGVAEFTIVWRGGQTGLFRSDSLDPLDLVLYLSRLLSKLSQLLNSTVSQADRQVFTNLIDGLLRVI